MLLLLLAKSFYVSEMIIDLSGFYIFLNFVTNVVVFLIIFLKKIAFPVLTF